MLGMRNGPLMRLVLRHFGFMLGMDWIKSMKLHKKVIIYQQAANQL
jgi:hypothetical protein